MYFKNAPRLVLTGNSFAIFPPKEGARRGFEAVHIGTTSGFPGIILGNNFGLLDDVEQAFSPIAYVHSAHNVAVVCGTLRVF